MKLLLLRYKCFFERKDNEQDDIDQNKRNTRHVLFDRYFKLKYRQNHQIFNQNRINLTSKYSTVLDRLKF